jgi:hypothetical protein
VSLLWITVKQIIMHLLEYPQKGHLTWTVLNDQLVHHNLFKSSHIHSLTHSLTHSFILTGEVSKRLFCTAWTASDKCFSFLIPSSTL